MRVPPVVVTVALTILVLAACGGGGNGEVASDGAPDGETLYLQSCATCHQEDGSGLVGPELAGVHDRLSEGEIRTVILEGRGGRMPAWEGRFSEAELDAIVEHLRSFS